jgi:hypothetical protein
VYSWVERNPQTTTTNTQVRIMASFKTISVGHNFITYKELDSFYSDRAIYQDWRSQVESHALSGSTEYGCFGRVLPYEVSELADMLDLPTSLIEIAETLFDESDNSEDALEFALAVAKAMQLGVNYAPFVYHWAEWLLMNVKHGMIRYTDDHRVYEMGYAHRSATGQYVPPVERLQNALADALKARTEARNEAARNGLKALRASLCPSKGIDIDQAGVNAQLARASVEAAKVAIYTATAIEGVDNALGANSLENACIAAIDACIFAGEDPSVAKAAMRKFFLKLLESPVFRKVAG